MLYSGLAGRISRFFQSFDDKRPVGVVGHRIHGIAKSKLRFLMLFRLKTQPIQNGVRGHPQEIQNRFLAADVVDDDIFVTKIFFNPHHRGKSKIFSSGDIIAQAGIACRVFLGRARRLKPVLVLAGAILLILALPARSAQPTVVINEMLWMGSSGSTADEWIELRNLTDQSIDLSGWRLTKMSGGVEAPMMTIPAGQSIPANGFYLVSNYADTAANSVLAVTPNFVTTDVALSNSALQISLYDAGSVLVDRVDDGAGNPLAGRYVSADKVYASMERNPVPGDGTLSESWHTASRRLGFKDGKPELGTPGAVNSNGLPIASAGPDQSGVVGSDVNFDGSESVDPEGQALVMQWAFGDGSASADVTPKHYYAAAGEYTVTLTVNDGTDSATDSLKVTIAPAPAAAPTTSTITGSAETKTLTSCHGVLFSELFPNPDGVDDAEFIELFNATAKTVPLDDCAIWVNDARRYIFPPGSSMVSGAWLAIQKATSGLSLTNTGGTVTLKDSDGAVLDAITYPKSVENQTWAKLGQAWGWTNQPTSGTANKETIEEAEVPTSKKTSTKSAAKQKIKEPPLAVTITDVQTTENGDHVRIVGVITVPADVLAARTITVQDDTGATTVLLAEDAVKPKLGDQVELIGLVRTYQGRKRISVKSGDVQILQGNYAVTPKKSSLDQVDVDLADQLVEVSGLISSTSGAKIVIDDGTGESIVYLKSSTGIVKPMMQTGDRLVVVGIVSTTTAGVRILPRTVDDLRVERVLGVATSAPTTTKVLPTAPPNQSQWYWGLVGLGVLAAAVKPLRDYLKKRREKVSAP